MIVLAISIASYCVGKSLSSDHFSYFIVELSDRISLWELYLYPNNDFAIPGIVISWLMLGMVVFLFCFYLLKKYQGEKNQQNSLMATVWGCLSYFHFTILFQYINWISISITFNTDSEAQIEEYAALRAFAGLLAALNLALAAFNALQTKQSFQYDQKYSFRTFDVATTGVFVKFLASLLRIALP